ncbi:N-acetylmuramidase domain-containing protein [Stutzerimonas stutzeri]|uniref:N-acetylmuramidase domain-containing protein n=1 Tax=Stutzerimonas stutzeri TaxID=316 RepID=UPI00265878E0|nr:N-acetylmuramidase domain-containing protein [Stutzerimonas stutzeri]MCF6782578.1 N-acetylmuramidase domain-containing protein [Stutzerimonas stutzeri]MCF6805683.1 N-acetylmuramidase domain-containing protein [Stutzerimonas stutzeri]
MTQLLSNGSRGLAVRNLQAALALAGYKVEVDGDFGDNTEAAVSAYQRKVGLVVDGVAGPKTQAALQGYDTSRYLKRKDLQQAAERLGVPLASVMAINQVESRGEGFAANGRPVILFERHVMHQRLQASGLSLAEADALAEQYPGLVNRKTGGYLGGTAEHQRLANAKQIHAAAALESASWGLFQIMGYHWQRLGYLDAQHFADTMALSEAAQLDAFVSFIEADPALHKALKARNWKQFARIYNGPNYAKNLYDVKLARAYAQFADEQEKAA